MVCWDSETLTPLGAAASLEREMRAARLGDVTARCMNYRGSTICHVDATTPSTTGRLTVNVGPEHADFERQMSRGTAVRGGINESAPVLPQAPRATQVAVPE